MGRPSHLDKQLQRHAREYLESTNARSIDLDSFVKWLKDNHHWAPDEKRINRLARADVSHALSEERFTDPDGERVRKYLFVKKNQHGEQLSLAIPMETISKRDMVLNIKQRRRDILARLLQIKTDLDHFNKFVNAESPIQGELFDFRYEVKEAMAKKGAPTRSSSATESKRPSGQSPASARQSVSQPLPVRP